MARALFDQAGSPKEFVTIPGAGHGGYALVEGPAYAERLRRFFEAALHPDAG
jgi:hypothetical protein